MSCNKQLLVMKMDSEATYSKIITSKASNKLSMIKVLFTHGYSVDDAAMDSLSSVGDEVSIEIVKLMRNHDVPWSLTQRDLPALRGNLFFIRELRSLGCPWGVDTFQRATEGGHVEVMDWLLNQGCPSNGKEAVSAVMSRNWTVLKWLKKNKFKFDSEAFFEAAQACDMAMMDYVGFDEPKNDKIAIRRAITGPRSKVIQVLDHLKARSHDMDSGAIISACRCFNEEAIRWLIDNKCPCDEEGLLTAVLHELRFVAMDLVNYGVYPSEVVEEQAKLNDDRQLAMWLRMERLRIDSRKR